MTDLLNTKTNAGESQAQEAADRLRRRSRRTRLAGLLAGLAAVVAVGVGVAANDGSGPSRSPEQPVVPFVTIDPPTGSGGSSADG
jgi:ferric-dicitrate binding protein FerR (iron transport regulator)